ncbi:MAG: rRNA maturation RNase YbeY [Phycisphaerales bacterium]|nr:MAG: rRNA maturation RNase YbeY [Phycisphaerales bacterium]
MDDDTPYDICVACECGDLPISESELRRTIERTLARHACPKACLSVALVDDARIAAVNRQYLHRRGPTDVISFDLGGDDHGVDGEVVLSAETARRESLSRGHSVAIEILLYAVHGTLHLLGFDDRTQAGAKAMHEEEDRILTELGYGPVYGSDAR